MTIRDKCETDVVLDVRRRWVEGCSERTGLSGTCAGCLGLMEQTPQEFLDHWDEAREAVRELRRRNGEQLEDV